MSRLPSLPVLIALSLTAVLPASPLGQTAEPDASPEAEPRATLPHGRRGPAPQPWMTHLPLLPRDFTILEPGGAYGWRVHPLRGDRRFHHGLDLTAARGVPIYAVGPGVLIEKGWEPGFGNWALVEHRSGDGTRARSFYAHMQGGCPLPVGATVDGNTRVGRVGLSGAVTGAHLHFEVWIEGRGEPVPGARMAGYGSVDPERLAVFPRGASGPRRLPPMNLP